MKNLCNVMLFMGIGFFLVSCGLLSSAENEKQREREAIFVKNFYQGKTIIISILEGTQKTELEFKVKKKILSAGAAVIEPTLQQIEAIRNNDFHSVGPNMLIIIGHYTTPKPTTYHAPFVVKFQMCNSEASVLASGSRTWTRCNTYADLEHSLILEIARQASGSSTSLDEP